MSTLTKQNRLYLQSGFSMLEVMVSIIIFSFGMLALAGLQLSAFKYQSGATTRATVATLSTDIAERLRLNVDGARAGSYAYTVPYNTAKAATLTVANCGAACSAQQTAQNDIARWLTEAQTTLPGGAVNITGNATSGFIATVMWFDKETAVPDSDPLEYATSEACAANQKSTDARNCCPPNTPPGIRCINTTFLP
jgi:type IV pilus assembly protein PilV